MRRPDPTLRLCVLMVLAGCGDAGGTTAGSSGEGTTTGTSGEDTTGTPTTTGQPGTSDTGVGTEDASGSTGTTAEPTTGDTTTDGTGSSTGGSSSESGSESSTGAAVVCGDGVVAGDEVCDDGNDVETDECLASCQAAACGDGLVQDGVELCDDGMGSPTCDPDCTPAQCGDGVLNAMAGEACDDGNALDSDECVPGCVVATCGDGFVQAGVEACDDGNDVEDDACNQACEPQVAELRPDVRFCGFTNYEPSEFFPANTDFDLFESCEPDLDTQALFITREAGPLDGAGLQAYLAAGGIVLTEYNISDEVFTAVFEFVPEGQGNGECQDTAPTVVQFTPDDPLWQAVPFQAIGPEQTGCGRDVGEFPGVTPLAGWDANNVALAYRDLGLGRLYLTDFDWTDGEMLQDLAPTKAIMGWMMTHRK